MLDLDKIQITKTNPRKQFHQDALEELSQSIKAQGVLQPILVRPSGLPSKTAIGWEGYELICGERRYLAATMAGLVQIPASIRNLSDDEAFEAQIVENLERKDVHPLEEADAFQRMLDSKRYTIADISAKMAKSEVFITHRLKLTNLIDEIKQDFFDDKIGIGHAVLIARLTPEAQKEILEYSKQGYSSDGYGTINQLRNKIDRGLYNLKDAAFKISDEKLLPEIGSCMNCLKRSGANPVLFADIEDENKCFDASCFGQKMKAHIMREVEKVVSGGKETFLLAGYSNQPDKEVLEYVKQFKVPILKEYDEFSTYDYHGANAKKVKGFYVVGSDAGKYKSVYLKLKGKHMPEAVDPVKEQVTKIKERAKRALELDDEKVWNCVRNGGDGEIGITIPMDTFVNCDEPLSNHERMALLLAIRKTTYGCKIPWIEKLDVKTVENGGDIPDSVLNEAFRKFINSQLNQSYGSHTTDVGNAALFHSLKGHFSNEIYSIKNHFQIKAEKRIERTKVKLMEVEQKQKSPVKKKTSKSKKKK